MLRCRVSERSRSQNLPLCRSVTVSVRLQTERTLRYHNKHQGLWSTVSVHQLMTESVESESEWPVTAGTGELLRQLEDCGLTAMAGKPIVHLA